MRLGQFSGNGVLDDVGVLKFVDHEVDVTVLIPGRDIWMLFQHPVHFQQEIVEIYCARLRHQQFVSLVNPTDHLFKVAGGSHSETLRAQEAALSLGNAGLNSPGREPFRVNVSFAHAPLDDVQLVGVVIYGEVPVQADEVALPPEGHRAK